MSDPERIGNVIAELAGDRTCKRAGEELPLPQVLEGHHVIEVQDGGSDDAANVWIICTPCHRQVHHLRTYLGHYHKRGADR